MQAIAEALLEGGCFSANVATAITAETSAVFEVIEGCERDDFSFGDAFGSTSGSTAEGVRSPNPSFPVHVLSEVYGSADPPYCCKHKFGLRMLCSNPCLTQVYSNSGHRQRNHQHWYGPAGPTLHACSICMVSARLCLR